MKFLLNSRFRRRALAALTLLVGCFLIMLTFVTVMNADLYGRLIETMPARGVGSPDANTAEVPTARLVLHKLPADENAVEASIVLAIDGGALAKEIREGKAQVAATVRDGSSYQPYGIASEVVLEASTAKAKLGVGPLAVESDRFLLPALPSLGGYPFDELQIRPIVDVTINGLYTDQFRLEIQKALPGRLLEVSDENIAALRLTRSPTEKALVIISSIIFLFLSGLLTYGLIAARQGLTTVEEIVAVGGYLIAAAGFRDLLGLSRAAGTSALEIAVIGVPLLLLSIGVAVSFVRGRLHAQERLEHARSPSSENNLREANEDSATSRE